MPNWVTIKKHSEATGYTQAAIRAKIAGGVWLEGVLWRKAPDGRVLISTEAFDLWAEGRESELLAEASRWTSATRASAAGNGSD